jgi:hypothetical protein
MKRLVFPLLVLSLALILPVLTGCPQEPEVPGNNQEDDGSGGKPNDGQNDADSNGGQGEDNSGGNQEDGTSGDGQDDNPGDGDDTPDNSGGGQGDDPAPANIPSGHLGDGPLVLKGKVYTEVQDLENFTVTYTPYTKSDVVMAEGTFGEKLGEGSLTNGELTISITKKPADLRSISTEQNFNRWGSLKAVPVDARDTAIYIWLRDANRTIAKMEEEVSGNLANFSGASKSVHGLYVDRDVVITLGENKILNGSWTTTYKAAVLELKKGWNVLFWDVSGSGSASGFEDGEFLNPKGSYDISIYVGNPDLKWTIGLTDAVVGGGIDVGGTDGDNGGNDTGVGGGDAGFNDPGIGYGQFPNNSFFSAP